jgi:hypothetical protein
MTLSSSGLFFGTVSGKVTTIVNNVSANYISNLQAA